MKLVRKFPALRILLAVALSLAFSQAASAKEKECCWINVKTGKQVPTVPAAGVNISGIIKGAENGVAMLSADKQTAFNPKTGKNYAKQKDGCWIDVKTGKQVPTVPAAGINISGIIEGTENGIAMLSADKQTAFNPKTGQNYARVPCPENKTQSPPTPTPSTTDKVTNALKTIGSSIDIGIGISGGGHDHHDRVRGEDRTRTAEKVHTVDKTHKTSPSTAHKTVTSACKCHPCTCSPCTCH